MKRLSALLGFGVLCVSMTAVAQSAPERMPLPSYPDFMKACVVSIAKNTDPEPGSATHSDDQLVLFTLLCQCTHDRVSPLGSFGAEEYNGAINQCLNQAQSDTEGFVSEYGVRNYENLKKYSDEE